ncbi:ATP-dependent endonuclease [Sphingobium sp. SCG-1]|uniref:AAA family ATPase n=1 Tax=Sphingobium sp. SCG-1 TaxID=2072936 RepID=UPI000CD6862A|nr:AAA family ATPase [Sphingobium sp. SCG-1]AUW57562.1 ATP-dependent endonuclease [Sphingobium sp. SCG-1]
MRIESAEIRNFRLLADAALALEGLTTVIVGRNNSGKTSLSEIMKRLLTDSNASFQLEDFSSASYSGFCAALDARNAGTGDEAVRTLLPAIELRIRLNYDIDQPEFGPLAPFVVDLDPDCQHVLVVIRYELKDGAIAALFEGASVEALTDETRIAFFRLLRERVSQHYSMTIRAEDPNDATNVRVMQPGSLKHLVKTGFINAQRGLDDVTSRESDVLAKVLESMFSMASSEAADEGDKAIADALTTAVQDIQTQLDQNFAGQLSKLLPTLKSFGYPGLGGQDLQTETILDVKRLLSNFTKVRYAGFGGVPLPESYNGLGVRNLIFILLQLVGFYKAYRAEPVAAGVHLVFIEEPEAHLHPQMQEVFIRQLANIAKQLVDGTEDDVTWPVQFVVSTHSSHIANAAGFESIRYFLAVAAPDAPAGVRQTRIKDLRRGLADKPEPEKRFLHQYMTLTRCDLFFADKAILVEGLSERLMLPGITRKFELAEPEAPKLSTQYTSIIEVGGAYAHRFVDLLEFLELRTLIITDLDSTLVNGGEACAVHLGTATSNACIKSWFDDDPLTLAVIAAKPDDAKRKGCSRIAYQCPEILGGPCGRTFEDAFILANAAKFGVAGADTHALEIAARAKAATFKKSDFALTYAIEDEDWGAPKYLTDGIRWLAHEDVPPTDPVLAVAIAVAAEAEANVEAAPEDGAAAGA